MALTINIPDWAAGLLLAMLLVDIIVTGVSCVLHATLLRRQRIHSKSNGGGE